MHLYQQNSAFASLISFSHGRPGMWETPQQLVLVIPVKVSTVGELCQCGMLTQLFQQSLPNVDLALIK